jgi:hypothetical protein
LNTTHWNRKNAAALLKIDYNSLLYKMKKLGIQSRRDGGRSMNDSGQAAAGVPPLVEQTQLAS